MSHEPKGEEEEEEREEENGERPKVNITQEMQLQQQIN